MLWADVDDLVDPNHPYSLEALEIASWLLYKMTGEKYPGVRTVTEAYNGGESYFLTSPVVINGGMYNIPVSSHGSSLNNYGIDRTRVFLRGTPVRKILEVVELGKTLPQNSYTLRDKAFIRKNNGLPWVYSNTSELLVTYEFGAKPPSTGKNAAIRLADEFYWYYTNDDKCSLPASLTNITRQGVSVTVLDPQEFLSQGRTGIYDVDLFIKTANPRNALKKSKLFVPGRVRGERIN